MDVSELKNLGPVSAEWLHAVGIHSKDDLERLGAGEAFRLIKLYGFNASLNLLFALEGALRDVQWNKLSPTVKARLRQAAKGVPS